MYVKDLFELLQMQYADLTTGLMGLVMTDAIATNRYTKLCLWEFECVCVQLHLYEVDS